MHDLAVVGLGALGVQTAAEAAARGLSVVGIEQSPLAHELGATGGRTRIFRVVYTFGPDYVPALLESRESWERLEQRHAGEVWHPHGALIVGSPEDPEVRSALESARVHDLPHEILDPAGLVARYPAHRPATGDIAVVDPLGALMLPQSTTALLAEEAAADGATLRFGARATGLRAVPGGTEVVLASGENVSARKVVVAAGAWTSHLVPAYSELVQLRRVVLQWYPTDDARSFAPDRFPVGLRRSGGDVRYSFFPQVDEFGIKVNFHVPKLVVDSADTAVNPVPAEYAEGFAETIAATLSGVGSTPTRSAAFVESYTDDFRIVLDRVPDAEGIWVLGGGSGQAYKLAPALARAAVDRVLGAGPDDASQLKGVVRGLVR